MEPPRLSAPVETVVVDIETHTQLMWFDSAFLAPVGTVIHIDNIRGGDMPQVPLDEDRFPRGRADATVIGVRIWGTQSPMRCVCLEVQLSAPGASDFDYLNNPSQ